MERPFCSASASASSDLAEPEESLGSGLGVALDLKEAPFQMQGVAGCWYGRK